MTILDMFSLLGGVGLFLFGMTTMSSGLKNACGDNLQGILEKATRNKVVAVFVGIAITILIQSSSATDVMVIGFVNAGMMNLAQAIGVIMGANIGTTITAQITAFNLSAYAPLILFLGAAAYLFVKKSTIKHVGEIFMGFGMLFVGIASMKEAIKPLSESQGFIDFVSHLDNPFLAFLFGIAFTALLQSSSSSTVIFQTFAIQGLLNYHTAVYLIIGAAIGSVTPNLLASLTTNRNGKRTAVLNLTFNVIRAILLISLINLVPQLLDLIQSLSPGDVGRQIANTHTIFAIIAVCVELPFANKIIKLVEKIIPIKEEESQQLKDRSLQYMTNIRSVPTSLAIDQAHREIVRMGRIAEKNLDNAINCFFNYSPELADSVRRREESVNILNHTISDALAGVRSFDLNKDALKRVSAMALTVSDLERLSDHAENIVEYIEDMNAKKAKLSEEARKELRHMARDAFNTVRIAIDIFETEEYERLEEVEFLENNVDNEQVTFINHHVQRLMKSECDPVSGVIFTDMVTNLERCSDHGVNIAYALKGHPSQKNAEGASKEA